MEKKIYLLIIPIVLLVGIGIFILYEFGQFPQIPSNGNISDEQLLQYAKSSFDKKEVWGKDFILGYHNDIPVRVSFPCSDVCPDYTIRIVRYDVDLSDCTSIGGEIKSIHVPVGIGAMAKEFCFPKVIVDNNIYEFIEK